MLLHVFHGSLDKIIPIELSYKIVNAARDAREEYGLPNSICDIRVITCKQIAL